MNGQQEATFFDKLIQSVYISDSIQDVTFGNMMLCFGISLVLGLLISYTYMRCSRCSRGFALSLVILPTAVNAVILLVNGNLGMSIAVLGTFSLVRFRSAQGSAYEITAILIATAVGLACGVGYVWIAVLLALLLCLVMVALYLTRYGASITQVQDLRILVPESMNYTDMFDDIFAEYTKSAMLSRTKTTAMGSAYELTYQVKIRDQKRNREMIDLIRQRNGNLAVTLTARMRAPEEM